MDELTKNLLRKKCGMNSKDSLAKSITEPGKINSQVKRRVAISSSVDPNKLSYKQKCSSGDNCTLCHIAQSSIKDGFSPSRNNERRNGVGELELKIDLFHLKVLSYELLV